MPTERDLAYTRFYASLADINGIVLFSDLIGKRVPNAGGKNHATDRGMLYPYLPVYDTNGIAIGISLRYPASFATYYTLYRD